MVGVGSKNVNGKDFSGKMVYAMKVTDTLSLEQYDQLCRSELTGKIPDIRSKNYEEQVGDCIYNFESNPLGSLRPSVHGIGNRDTDFGGKNSLLSTHFYYFGDQPIDIPEDLTGIIRQGQGHKSTANNHLQLQVVEWIENLGYHINSLNGKPQIKVLFKKTDNKDGVTESSSCQKRCLSAEEDEALEI